LEFVVQKLALLINIPLIILGNHLWWLFWGMAYKQLTLTAVFFNCLKIKLCDHTRLQGSKRDILYGESFICIQFIWCRWSW
jgi:hypothetical protein